MARKKKISGLSMAIVALNIVIAGIIILLIALIYLHMKEDTGDERTDDTTSSIQTESSATEDSDLTSDDSSVTKEADASETTEDDADITSVSYTMPTNYNKDYFSNDLFIGDSISTGLYGYGYLEADNVFAEVGLNPESALTKDIDGVTCIQKASAMQPRNIYIMLGTNGLAFLDSSYMTTKMAELVEALETACPSSDIYIISIPPVTKAHDAEGSETMEKVNKYNSELEAKFGSGKHAFIDICSRLKDSEGYFDAKYAEEDGLHFLGNTYIAVLGYIEQSLG